jgi:hypothetical protein
MIKKSGGKLFGTFQMRWLSPATSGGDANRFGAPQIRAMPAQAMGRMSSAQYRSAAERAMYGIQDRSQRRQRLPFRAGPKSNWPPA